MKNLTLIIFILFSSVSFGQLTLENSYITNDLSNNGNFFNTQIASYYYTFNDISNVMNIYNENHILYKTVNIPENSGFEIKKILFATDKLFNSDSLIEFIVISETSYLSTGIEYKMILLNEDGITLFDFGNRADAYLVKTVTDNYKLIVSNRPGDAIPSSRNMTSDVYSLTGTLSVNQINILSKKIIGFPNPAKEIINITNPLKNNQNSVLKIYTINGNEVLRKNIQGNETDFISLDVSSLSAGVYIYKINNYSNRFIKE